MPEARCGCLAHSIQLMKAATNAASIPPALPSGANSLAIGMHIDDVSIVHSLLRTFIQSASSKVCRTPETFSSTSSFAACWSFALTASRSSGEVMSNS